MADSRKTQMTNLFDAAVDFFEDYDPVETENKMASLDNFSRYTEKQFIARGGMKTVSKVYDELVGRVSVMAELRDPFDEVARELFIREAHINAILQHPNILPIYDFGFTQANHPYFIMKLLKGKTLNKYLRTINPVKARNSLLAKFIDICEGVAYAHSLGIMHLDLKPDNIWIGNFGETLVMDWGLAKLFESKCDERLLDSEVIRTTGATVYGAVRGTPGYMSPEQANKKSAINFKSDIFSLGAILYKIVTGKAPFTGSSVEEVIKCTKKGDFRRPSQLSSALHVPESLDAIITKALSTNPDDRYKTVEELAKDVQFYLDGFVTSAEKAGFIKRIKLVYLRNKKIANVILITTFLISLISSVSIKIIDRRTELAREQQELVKLKVEELEKEKVASRELGQIAGEELFNRGKEKLFRGKFNEAMKLLQKSKALGHDTAELHYLISGLFFSKQKFTECRKSLREAISSLESNNEVRLEAVLILKKFNKAFANENYSISKVLEFYYMVAKENLISYTRFITTVINSAKMTVKEKESYIKTQLLLQNRSENLKVAVTNITGELKVDLSNNKENLHWGGDLYKQPVVELNVSNTLFGFSPRRPFPKLKVLKTKNSRVASFKFITASPLEEVHVGEFFKNGFKELPNFKTLKVVRAPKSFAKQDKVVKALKKNGVKLIFE